MYKGLVLIVCLTIVTLILITTFRPHTAGLHQTIVSIYWVELFVPLWLLVIGVSQTSLMVGGTFRSKALLALWEEKTDPSAVRCGTGRLSLCDCKWRQKKRGYAKCSYIVSRNPYCRFRNLNSTVPVDVVREMSYVDSLLNSTRVPVRVSVNKLNFQKKVEFDRPGERSPE